MRLSLHFVVLPLAALAVFGQSDRGTITGTITAPWAP
jgi:hypothetical protein